MVKDASDLVPGDVDAALRIVTLSLKLPNSIGNKRRAETMPRTSPPPFVTSPRSRSSLVFALIRSPVSSPPQCVIISVIIPSTSQIAEMHPDGYPSRRIVCITLTLWGLSHVSGPLTCFHSICLPALFRLDPRCSCERNSSSEHFQLAITPSAALCSIRMGR